MAFLIIEKGNRGDIGKKFPLNERAALIGRGTDSQKPDIMILDEHVSRRHAEISFNNNYFLLRDLKSTNGTTLNGIRIEPEKLYRLQQDSIIGLAVFAGTEARVVLRFKESPTTATTRVVLTDEATPVTWLRIDAEKDEIYIDGKQIVVSRKEYDLILCLQSKAGKVCSKDEIIAKVYPEAVDIDGVSDAAIDQLLHRLRIKIEPDPTNPQRLISRRGFGYMLV